jgi:hypothetical protein
MEREREEKFVWQKDRRVDRIRRKLPAPPLDCSRPSHSSLSNAKSGSAIALDRPEKVFSLRPSPPSKGCFRAYLDAFFGTRKKSREYCEAKQSRKQDKKKEHKTFLHFSFKSLLSDEKLFKFDNIYEYIKILLVSWWGSWIGKVSLARFALLIFAFLR